MRRWGRSGFSKARGLAPGSSRTPDKHGVETPTGIGRPCCHTTGSRVNRQPLILNTTNSRGRGALVVVQALFSKVSFLFRGESVSDRIEDQFRIVAQAELLHETHLVRADGLRAKRERLGDLVDARACSQHLQHLKFAVG